MRKKTARELKAGREAYLKQQEEHLKSQVRKAADSLSDICYECQYAITKNGGRLGVEVFESADDNAVFEVWLTHEDACDEQGRLVALHQTNCPDSAEFIGRAVHSLLGTPQGQQQARDFLQHLIPPKYHQSVGAA